MGTSAEAKPPVKVQTGALEELRVNIPGGFKSLPVCGAPEQQQLPVICSPACLPACLRASGSAHRDLVVCDVVLHPFLPPPNQIHSAFISVRYSRLHVTPVWVRYASGRVRHTHTENPGLLFLCAPSPNRPSHKSTLTDHIKPYSFLFNLSQ